MGPTVTKRSRDGGGAASRAERPVRPAGDGGGTAGRRRTEPQTPPAREDCDGTGRQGKLLEEALRRENLAAAKRRVVKNGGAPGVDGMTVDELDEFLRSSWDDVHRDLLAGRYVPKPVRRVEIPKPDGKGTRVLGIPCVVDRLIQQALLQMLTPILDPGFSDSSYGYRPGRSAHQAVLRARDYVAQGNRWVVDLDLQNFFDTVNHDVLMARLARRVKDKKVLRLIRSYLRAGMMEGGLVSCRQQGTPQGGPLSPLLSNVLLDDLDRELETRGHSFVRYADDCNVYVRTEQAGRRVMDSLERFLEKRLRLHVNREKSAVDRPWRRSFLGYSVTSGRQPKLRISEKSRQRFTRKVRAIMRRGRGRALRSTCAELNRLLVGWISYFRHAQTPSVLTRLDGWIRRRLRLILWRHWKRPRTRRKNLLRRGANPYGEGLRKWWTRGPWAHSGSMAMRQALPPSYFAALGLVSLLAEHRRLSRPM